MKDYRCIALELVPGRNPCRRNPWSRSCPGGAGGWDPASSLPSFLFPFSFLLGSRCASSLCLSPLRGAFSPSLCYQPPLSFTSFLLHGRGILKRVALHTQSSEFAAWKNRPWMTDRRLVLSSCARAPSHPFAFLFARSAILRCHRAYTPLFVVRSFLRSFVRSFVRSFPASEQESWSLVVDAEQKCAPVKEGLPGECWYVRPWIRTPSRGSLNIKRIRARIKISPLFRPADVRIRATFPRKRTRGFFRGRRPYVAEWNWVAHVNCKWDRECLLGILKSSRPSEGQLSKSRSSRVDRGGWGRSSWIGVIIGRLVTGFSYVETNYES